MSNPRDRRVAELALVGVTLIWGLTFPLISEARKDVGSFAFVAARFGLAAFLCAPILWRRRKGLLQSWRGGLLLGFLAWTSYLSQTIGLGTVKAGPAAFITATSVVMVPLLSPLFGSGRPRALDLAAASVATVGLYLLCDPGAAAEGAGFLGWITAGDLWILLCAFTYAIYIHVLQVQMKRGHASDVIVFQQVASVAILSLVALPLLGSGESTTWSVPAVVAVLFCAIFATLLSFWLQARYQPRTTPERTALIFTLEPVFAAVFAWFLLHEQLTGKGLLGAGLIFVAILLAEVLTGRLGKPRED